MSDWRNYRYNLPIDSLTHPCQIKRCHLAHVTHIDQTLSIDLWRETSCLKYVATGKTFGVSTKFLHRRHNSGANQAIQNILDDFDRDFVGYSQAIYKTRCLARLPHALSNCLPTTVNQNRVNPYGLKKDDVTQKALNQVIIFHRAAAVLDDKSLASKPLDKRQRFQKRLSLPGFESIQHFGVSPSRYPTRPC